MQDVLKMFLEHVQDFLKAISLSLLSESGYTKRISQMNFEVGEYTICCIFMYLFSPSYADVLQGLSERRANSNKGAFT